MKKRPRFGHKRTRTEFFLSGSGIRYNNRALDRKAALVPPPTDRRALRRAKRIRKQPLFVTLATHAISLPEYVRMLEDYGSYAEPEADAVFQIARGIVEVYFGRATWNRRGLRRLCCTPRRPTRR